MSRRSTQVVPSAPQQPIAPPEAGLNTSDSLGVIGLIVTVLTFVFTPPWWAKIGLLLVGAVCCVFFLERSRWLGSTPRKARHVFSTILVLVLCGFGIPQILHQREEGLPPELSWVPYKTGTSNGANTALAYDNKSPQDLIIYFEGRVQNKGGPSTTSRWEAKLKLPNDTVQLLGALLIPDKAQEAKNIHLEGLDGTNARLPLGAAYLPEITASEPVPARGAKSGLVIFIFKGLNYPENPKTLVGARITLTFYDVFGKQVVYEDTKPAVDTAPSWTEFIPGMPKAN